MMNPSKQRQAQSEDRTAVEGKKVGHNVRASISKEVTTATQKDGSTIQPR